MINANNAKRAQEEGSERPSKARRARYVAVACDECKRRKVKCGGQMPCKRCYDLRVACIYQTDNRERSKESQLFEGIGLQMQLVNDKLDRLTDYVTTNNGRNGVHATAGGRSGMYLSDGLRQKRRTHSSGILDQPQSLCPGFRGPTSSSFIFEVAKDSLAKMGLSPEVTNSDTGASHETMPPTPPYQQRERAGSSFRLFPDDALCEIGEAEALKLCQIFDESFGIMFPVLDMARVNSNVHRVFALPETSFSPGAETSHPGLDDDDPKFEVNIVKLICAIALASAGCGKYAKAQNLYDDIEDAAEAPIWDAMGIKGLQYLTLVALYHVQIGQDVRASRIISLAARLSLEMGLNRREVLLRTFPDEKDRDLAVRIFWSIYMLDMRASCGIGIPFVIQDVDLDPTLPEPDCSYLYLKTMIGFARLSGKVWRVANAFNTSNSSFATDDIEYLDYQVLQWQKRIPEALRYEPSNSDTFTTGEKEPLFARAVTYARTNQLRSLIYRRVLYSSSRIAQNMILAQTVVDIAKSTVSFVADLHHTTDLYRAQPVIFNHFLVSALGVLLLAIANAPDNFSRQCRNEYYTALRLLKQSAMTSQISMRLWKTIEGLEGLGPMLGLAPPPPDQSRVEAVSDASHLGELPSANAFMDLNQYDTAQLSTSGLRDDLANLFGFTADVMDQALFLPPDTSGSNLYNIQLGDILSGTEAK